MQYEDSFGNRRRALFEAFRVRYVESCSGPSVFAQKRLCESALASPGQIVLPCDHTFDVPEAWRDLATWSTEDTSATCSAGLLIVDSTTTVRNAMYAALALAAVGGILDSLEFDVLPEDA